MYTYHAKFLFETYLIWLTYGYLLITATIILIFITVVIIYNVSVILNYYFICVDIKHKL